MNSFFILFVNKIYIIPFFYISLITTKVYPQNDWIHFIILLDFHWIYARCKYKYNNTIHYIYGKS